MSFDLLLGDCIERMAEMSEASVDAIVTDPPYGINFMGKAWDGKAIEEAAAKPRPLAGVTRLTGSPESSSRHLIERTGSAYQNRAGEAGAYDFSPTGNRAFQRWVEQWATEALRILKPGGHAVVFGGTRTYHRLAAGLEDAGFEIRDCLAWMYGSGFPKSLDVAKAIDKDAGHWRGRAGDITSENGSMSGPNYERNDKGEPVTAAAAAAAAAWNGWGTALKPAFEPVVVARKPLVGTVAGNVLAHGTGALNIDACRIPTAETCQVSAGSDFAGDGGWKETERESNDLGRWPANVVLDEEAASILDEQTGELISGEVAEHHRNNGKADDTILGKFAGGIPLTGYGDRGGASRFFYVAKVSAIERNAGLDDFEPSAVFAGNLPNNPKCEVCRRRRRVESFGVPTCKCEDPQWAPDRDREKRNIHPTVKPVSLMRWLVRLVTPPGGLILDPFLGSGSTGIGAVLEGFRFVGIEREQNYMDIARARIEFWAEHGEEALEQVRKAEAAAAVRVELAAMGQQSLFGDEEPETTEYDGPIPVPYDVIPY